MVIGGENGIDMSSSNSNSRKFPWQCVNPSFTPSEELTDLSALVGGQARSY